MCSRATSARRFGRPARVVKLKVGKGKISRETAVVIPNDVGIVSGFLDDAGEYGYFGTYSNPGVVLKVEEPSKCQYRITMHVLALCALPEFGASP